MVSREKAEKILKMEKDMRSLSDEAIFDRWLMCGVPDGDIIIGTTIEEIMEMYDGEDFKMFSETYDNLKKYL